MTFLRAIVGGLAVSAALLLSGCGAKLDDASVRELVAKADAANAMHDSAAMDALLDPQFEAYVQAPELGTHKFSRAEALEVIGDASRDSKESRTINSVEVDSAANTAVVRSAMRAEGTFMTQGPYVETSDEVMLVAMRDDGLKIVRIDAVSTSLTLGGRRVY